MLGKQKGSTSDAVNNMLGRIYVLLGPGSIRKLIGESQTLNFLGEVSMTHSSQDMRRIT